MFLKSSLLMTSGLGFDTYVREEVREERVQVNKQYTCSCRTLDWHVALASWHAGVWSSCRKVYVRDAANVT